MAAKRPAVKRIEHLPRQRIHPLDEVIGSVALGFEQLAAELVLVSVCRLLRRKSGDLPAQLRVAHVARGFLDPTDHQAFEAREDQRVSVQYLRTEQVRIPDGEDLRFPSESVAP